MTRKKLPLFDRALLGPADLGSRDVPLRIAPDGALHYLPYELLDDPIAPGAPLVERTAATRRAFSRGSGWWIFIL